MIRSNERLIKDLELSEKEMKHLDLDLLNYAIDRVEKAYDHGHDGQEKFIRPWLKVSGKPSYSDHAYQVIVWVREGSPPKGLVMWQGAERGMFDLIAKQPYGYGGKTIFSLSVSCSPLHPNEPEYKRISNIRAHVEKIKKNGFEEFEKKKGRSK